MKKKDLIMSNPDIHCVIYTDFGAILDLICEKDHSSVNNHTVICIFFICTNWRRVNYIKKNQCGEDELDNTILNNCERWVFFGAT